MNTDGMGDDEMQEVDSMRFDNAEGESFELQLTGYEFPHIIDSEWDSNWLNTKIRVVSKDGNWVAIHPSLLTWEVERLIAWLEGLPGSAETRNRLEFTEPCLSFALVQSHGRPAIRVYFELEMRPPWKAARVAGMEDLWLDFPLSDLDLDAARTSLESQLPRYPRRAIGAN